MQELIATGGGGEEAVVGVDVEHQVASLEREGDTSSEVELQSESPSAVDLLLLVVGRHTYLRCPRVGELHDPTTSGEVGGEEGVGPEVELELTAVALDLSVGIL